MKTMSQIVQELVPAYLAARRQEVPQMMELLAASDFERLLVLGHSLKGSGGSFGFPELTRFGAALERSAQASDPVSFSQGLAQLKDYLDRLDRSPTAVPLEEASGPVRE